MDRDITGEQRNRPLSPVASVASPLLTSPEAADYLRIPLGTLYQLRSKGTGPVGVPVGRYTHYFRVDLDAWLRARRGTQ